LSIRTDDPADEISTLADLDGGVESLELFVCLIRDYGTRTRTEELVPDEQRALCGRNPALTESVLRP